MSRTGTRFPSVVVKDSRGVLAEVSSRDPDVVGIEEAQFFDAELVGALEAIVAAPRTGKTW